MNRNLLVLVLSASLCACSKSSEDDVVKDASTDFSADASTDAVASSDAAASPDAIASDAGPASAPTLLRGINNDSFAYSQGYGNGYGPAVTSAASYRYLYSRGLRLIRIHIVWGQKSSGSPAFQPTLGGPLDATELARLHEEIDNLKSAGMVAVIDIAGSCRYPTDHSPAVCGNGITIANVKDLWTRMSVELKDDPGVYAYDLMNEPHDMDTSVWQQYSQAMVDAIRARGDDKLIWVEMNNYSGVEQWTSSLKPWIKDPANKILYSAHTYPPSSNGGTWTTPAYASSDEAWLDQLKVFTTWCAENQQRCGIGELAVASNLLTSDWQKWNDLLERWYQAADATKLTVTYYSATAAWDQPNRAYMHEAGNTIVVGPSPPGIIPDIDTALSPATVIENHLDH